MNTLNNVGFEALFQQAWEKLFMNLKTEAADSSEMEDVIVLAQEKGLHSEVKKVYQELSRFKGIYQSQI